MDAAIHISEQSRQDAKGFRRARLRAVWVRRLVIFASAVILSIYVLAPVAWLVSSSVQTEAEITSVPPHWIPEEPTLQNYEAIFLATEDKEITYENRSGVDPVSGGFIPSTAKNLLPAMGNSLIVACAVVVLNLLVGVPAAYAIAKIRFLARDASVYFILTTRVIPDIALVVPFFLVIKNLGLLDTLSDRLAVFSRLGV